MKNLIILLFSAFIVSCASPAAQQQMEHGPEPVNYEEAINLFLDRNLKDPDSLKDFAILTEPRKGFLNYGAFETGPTGKTFSNPLWFVCVEYRAKNSFGAYTGLWQGALFFYDNKVVRAVKSMRGGGDLGNTSYSCY